jgi:threonylcarbamoyladenosine tRNA methylthiotransferase MtaB
VFTYSERADTEAAEMEGVVPEPIRKQRNKMLRVLSAKKSRAFYQSQIGSKQKVLWEGENKGGYIHGFTTNYLKCSTFWNPELINTIDEVEIGDFRADGSLEVLSVGCLK